MQNHRNPVKYSGKMSRLWIIFFIGAILFFSAGLVWSKTTIDEIVYNENTTWRLIESPYEVRGPVHVASGATLTVEAGVVVKFAQGGGYIDVQDGASIVVDGESASPVIFTDLSDDSAGGDTNGDGGLTSPWPGVWDGIVVKDGGNATLEYVHIRYAYQGIFKTRDGLLSMNDCIITDSLDAGLFLYFTNDANTISRCTFLENIQGILVWGPSGNVTIDECTLSGNNYGMSIWDTSGSVSLSECMVSDNGGYGIEISDTMPVLLTAGVSVVHSTVSNNDGPGIRIDNNSPLITNNIITGNTVGIECERDASPLIGGSPGNRNNIFKNTTFGVNNLSSGVAINATHNWWGDYSGPTHSSNPGGRGDTVSDNVDFSDFAQISALAGDLNNDNGVGLGDVIVGLQVMVGITPAIFHPEYVMAEIDVNGDDRAGLAETIFDLRDIAGLNE